MTFAKQSGAAGYTASAELGIVAFTTLTGSAAISRV
jgi:hypothetical protein